MKFYFCALLISLSAIFAGNQQERQYTTVIPARLVNSYIKLINGELNQITAKDYKELTDIIQPQLYQQFQSYMKEDSARQRAKDTIKTKKP